MSMSENDARWLDKAREIGVELMRLGAQRSDPQTPPTAELHLLKDGGLMGIAVCAENGGAGVSWRTVNEIVREITATDGSVGALLGYHVISVVHLRREAEEKRRELEREIVDNGFLLAGVANPRDDDIDVARVDGGYVFNGRKSFCTGAAFADRLTIYGRSAEMNAPILAYIPTDRDGITYHHDWDNLGLCRTDSGSFSLENVFVHEDEITVETDDDRTAALRALRTLVNTASSRTAIWALRWARSALPRPMCTARGSTGTNRARRAKTLSLSRSSVIYGLIFRAQLRLPTGPRRRWRDFSTAFSTSMRRCAGRRR